MGEENKSRQNKYIEKTFDRVNLTIQKGNKDMLKEIARIKDNGSVNALINRAISKLLEEEFGREWKM